MKELYMKMREEYQGSEDAFIQELARPTCEEFIKVDDNPCPNCYEPALLRNETQALCESCGQEFVYVESSLRFK